MAPLRDPGIATCSNTGITIPECCCNECLEGQVRRHRPAVLSRQEEALDASQANGASVSEPATAPSPPIGQAAPDANLG